MKKLIALTLAALVLLASGCTVQENTGPGSNDSPVGNVYGGQNNDQAGSPPGMPDVPETP